MTRLSAARRRDLIRGARGALINAKLAGTLAALVREERSEMPVRVVVTASEDAAGPRDRVTTEEREAVEAALREAGVAYRYEPTLAAAVRHALDGWAADDLVLPLGAQGMDRAAEIAKELLS